MKKFVCDTCGIESKDCESHKWYSESFPSGWIHININSFYNSNEIQGDRKLIQGSGEYHYCSKDCFVYYFFFSPKELEERDI